MSLTMLRGWSRASGGAGFDRLAGGLGNHRLKLLRALHLLQLIKKLIGGGKTEHISLLLDRGS